HFLEFERSVVRAHHGGLHGFGFLSRRRSVTVARASKGGAMEARRLGNTGLQVSAIGLGVMGMSEFYGKPDEAENEATLARAVEIGVTFWDTADAYGSGHNETMIGRFLAARGWRDRIVLATKFGFVREGGRAVGVSGKPDYVRSACDASLERL